MRKLIVASLALLLACAPASGQGNVGGGLNNASAAQIPGTRTSDNAASGNLGEVFTANVNAASPTAITNNTPTDVATIVNLPAGDWNCWANIGYSPANTTTMTRAMGWISTVSITIPAAPNNGAFVDSNVTFPTAGQTQVFVVGTERISLASPASVILGGFTTFGTSTNTVFGFLGCRRAR